VIYLFEMVPKIFYDGCDISKFGSYPNVVGFTTNTTIMRQSQQLNYKTFYEANKSLIDNRPISFQLFTDDPVVALEQARQIAGLGSNIYVKVPIMNSRGESFLSVAKQLLEEGIRVNVTAIFTKDQLSSVAAALSETKTPTIVSVFGGRISDTGVNPKEIVGFAVELFRENPTVEILWAGCKDNLVLQNARDVGCQIVTLPDAILSRINRLGQPLENLSQETVKSFLKDAVEGGLVIG
jgi:transaldolase